LNRFFRSGLALGLAMLFAIAGTPQAAQAFSSAQGLAANSFILTDLGATALTSAASTTATISAGELALASTAVATPAAVTGTAVAAGSSNVLGQAIVGIAALGGMALSYLPGFGQSLPTSTAGPTYTSGTCANSWVTGQALNVSCSASPSNDIQLSVQHTGGRTGVWLETCSSGSIYACGLVSSCNAGCGTSYAVNVARSPTAVTIWTVRYESNPGTAITSGSAVVGTFYVSGRTSGTASDPTASTYSGTRYIRSTIECRTPGGSLTTVTANSSTFTATVGVTPTLPEAASVECPAGTYLEGSQHDLITDGSSTVVPLTEPYEAPDWVGQQAIDFPECFPIGSTVCELKLWKVSVSPALDCHAYEPGSNHPCLDWSLDPDRSTRYECRFGANVLPNFKSCQAYKTVFRTSTFEATPDADTDTYQATVDPTPEMTPNDTGCVPRFEVLLIPWWVYKAGVCALVWAFVPTDLPDFGEVTSPIPAGWIPTFDEVPEGECGAVTMPSFSLGPLLPSTGSVLLVNTCADPWPLVRDVTYYGTVALLTATITRRSFLAVMSAAGMGVEEVGERYGR
jgi:hypothetical protein